MLRNTHNLAETDSVATMSKVDLEPLQRLARTHQVFVDESNYVARATEITRLANTWVKSNLGNRVVLFSTMVAIAEEGPLHESAVVGTVERVVAMPTLYYNPYFSSLVEVGTCHDLGLQVDPFYDLDKLAVSDEVRTSVTMASLFDTVTIPLGSNVLQAAEVAISAPPKR